MKIRALANGDVIDVSDEEAKPLIEAGIYEVVTEQPTQPAEEADSATKVEPMTTNTMPVRKRNR